MTEAYRHDAEVTEINSMQCDTSIVKEPATAGLMGGSDLSYEDVESFP